MPLYDYALADKNGREIPDTRFELFHSIFDDALEVHPETGKAIVRVIPFKPPAVSTEWAEPMTSVSLGVDPSQIAGEKARNPHLEFNRQGDAVFTSKKHREESIQTLREQLPRPAPKPKAPKRNFKPLKLPDNQLARLRTQKSRVKRTSRRIM